MTDFIISEGQIEQFGDYVEDDDNRSEEKYKNARSLAAKIRSRPLSEELKKERERTNKILIEISKQLPTIPNSAICDKEALLYIPACTVNRLNKLISESLRGEPLKDITVGNSGGNR